MRITRELLGKKASSATVILILISIIQRILKNVVMKLQKLGSVTFKSLMELDKCYSILTAYSALCGPKNYKWRNK